MGKCLKSWTIIVAVAVLFSACRVMDDTIDRVSSKDEAKSKLLAGARAFQAKRYEEARLRFEDAIASDPSNEQAQILLARTLHAQYLTGNTDSPATIELAEGAIAAYKKVLSVAASNDEAFSGVVSLLGKLNRKDEQRQFALEFANNSSITPEMRSNAYTILANNEWHCSYEITESPENRTVIEQGGKAIIQSKLPRDPRDFDSAQECATRGLEYAETAIQLGPDNPAAWEHKVVLLIELRKLTQMAGKTLESENYYSQIRSVLPRVGELNEQRRAKEPVGTDSESELDTLVPPVSPPLEELANPEPPPVPQRAERKLP